jgi:hypothetical protein
VDKDGNAHILEVPTVMDRCVARAVSGLLYDHEADVDTEVDTGEVVDEPPDEADSAAIKRLVHSQVDECANEIDNVASEGCNVVSQSIDGDTDGSDVCPAATCSPLPTHRCNSHELVLQTTPL